MKLLPACPTGSSAHQTAWQAGNQLSYRTIFPFIETHFWGKKFNGVLFSAKIHRFMGIRLEK